MLYLGWCVHPCRYWHRRTRKNKVILRHLSERRESLRGSRAEGALRLYSHDGPIRRRKHEYIPTVDQSRRGAAQPGPDATQKECRMPGSADGGRWGD
eukprot:7987415-Pyramimonas_sp.AAC.1